MGDPQPGPTAADGASSPTQPSIDSPATAGDWRIVMAVWRYEDARPMTSSQEQDLVLGRMAWLIDSYIAAREQHSEPSIERIADMVEVLADRYATLTETRAQTREHARSAVLKGEGRRPGTPTADLTLG